MVLVELTCPNGKPMLINKDNIETVKPNNADDTEVEIRFVSGRTNIFKGSLDVVHRDLREISD